MSKLSFIQFLLFSPYSRTYSYPVSVKNGTELFQRVRVVPKEFEDQASDLKKIISSPDILERFYILSGYSGNGKTTFLHWFKEKIEQENCYFEIINLIDKGYGVEAKEPLMRVCLTDKIVNEITDKEVINLICDHADYFSKLFSRDQMNCFRRIRSEATFNKEEANYIFEENQFEFSHILLLFLFQRIIKFVTNTELKNKETYTFCFDNLDELELEYLTPDMWRTVLGVIQVMPDAIGELGLDFEFARRIKIVLVFREANIAVSSSQLSDNLMPLIESRRFIFMPYIGKDIVNKRMEIYKQGDCSDYDQYVIKVLETIIKEKVTDYIILPLFNYDYRLFMEATIDIISNKLIDLSSVEYEKIPHEYKYGKRGIIINAYIKYLAKKNYLSRLAPVRHPLQKNKCYCNPTRLLLTVFSNLSYESQVNWENEKEMHEAKPNEFSMLSAYEACQPIFKIDEFFDKIANLIDINKSSWAHLITIYGIKPITESGHDRFDFSEIAKLLQKYLAAEDKEHSDFKELRDISFSLNASAYIYLRHLLTHFEYISAYKVRKNNLLWSDMRPLFQLIDLDTQENAELKWSFQRKIEEVFRHVDVYCSNIELYFQNVFQNTGMFSNKYEFCKSRYVFKGENKVRTDGQSQGHLYMSRLITSHIEYIENFRHYITGYGYEAFEVNINKLSKEIKATLITTKEDIHKYLLGAINKYLQLLENIQDPTQTNVLASLKDKAMKAQSDYSIWIKRDKE